MLNTHSSFRYGIEITNDNSFFPIDEGSGELLAQIRIGSYTLTDFATQIASALNRISEIENNYETTVNYETGQITISGDSNFSILLSSSSILAITAYSLAGFTTTSDLTGSASYEGDSRSGFIYNTQFIIQSFVDLEDQESLSSATINIPATGAFEEVISYGYERLMDGTFTYITDIFHAEGAPIRNNPTGKEDFLNLLRSLIRKQPVEFCKNEGDQQSFYKLILSGSGSDTKGTGFKLEELSSQGLSNYFRIKLKFREVI